MLKWIVKGIVGSQNQRKIKKLLPVVEEINRIESDLQSKPDEHLKELTAKWQAHLARYENDVDFYSDRGLERLEEEELNEVLSGWVARLDALKDEFNQANKLLQTAKGAEGASQEQKVEAILSLQDAWPDLKEKFAKARADYLEEILPEAYAVVKNAARRLLGTSWSVSDHDVKWEMVHFDVQLIGGIGLHRRNIAEMATGEGKTLVATLPVYLNALTGQGVHLVTVNDYLARRDSEWMGYLYRWLGLSVGCIQNSQSPEVRREQYQCDITYGTASEFGFDYLRDNGMATSVGAQVQRSHYFALIDEVDSILIDEARTPLIISGPVQVDNNQYERFKPMVSQLVKRQAKLTNDFAADAKKAADEGDLEQAGALLYRTRLGQPRHRQLMRMLEDPDLRRAMDKAELTFFQDPQKKALYEVKEEMFFTIDEKSKDAELTDKGREFLNPDDPEAFVLPDLADAFSVIDGDANLNDDKRNKAKQELQQKMDTQAQRIHNITQLLKAYCMYDRDKEYIVEENKVVILDENTGRAMPGRRWSDGLHQAVEAKEGVKIDKETQTLATITIQNYFRMYEKMAGMTGTAETEASEFHDIYKVDVLVIPTNRPVQRIDENDKVYKTEREKLNSVIEAVRESHGKGQPVLLGTASERSSETMARLLKREKIPHSVLNAKHHRQEAEIVARAGQEGSVTVATNMAGRGTDIKLGTGVRELGGLRVLGTERHPSRRIDRQLRGRCARQGDPGTSVFFVSFEDDLMRQYGASDRMTGLMNKLGLEEGQELEGGLLTKTVEMAQKRVEERNYLSRKRVLDYDDVMNQQREVVYGYRNEVLHSEDPRSLVIEVIEETLPAKMEEFVAEGMPEEDRDLEGLLSWVNTTFPLRIDPKDAALEEKSDEEILEFFIKKVKGAYLLKMQNENPDFVDDLDRHVILMAIDRLWREHLYAMDGLREGVWLRAQGQKDPLVEYKTEAYKMFVELMDDIKMDTLSNLFRSTTNLQAFTSLMQNLPQQLKHDLDDLFSGKAAPKAPPGTPQPDSPPEPDKPQINLPLQREVPKVGRNEPCPCGSGKKFKQCCGRNA